MNEEKLNSLLEDALEDLLVKDNSDEDVAIERSQTEVTGAEVGGASNSDPVKLKADLEETSSKIEKTRKKSKKKSAASSSSGPVLDEEQMNKFFENMAKELEGIKINPEEAQSKINETVPQIFDLMQNLLSKELLYPALKDLSPKFDEWLEKNGQTLSAKEKTRFKEQKTIIDEIIEVFDDETLDNQQRFERNLDLMEKMQSLGSPPEELTVPGGPERCSIM